jgi:hypothetical protein
MGGGSSSCGTGGCWAAIGLHAATHAIAPTNRRPQIPRSIDAFISHHRHAAGMFIEMPGWLRGAGSAGDHFFAPGSRRDFSGVCSGVSSRLSHS